MTDGRLDVAMSRGILQAEIINLNPDADRKDEAKSTAIFAENLAPGGLAYVSYNTFPGWHARGLARDLMAYHLRGGDDVHGSARAARAFLKDLVAILPDRRTMQLPCDHLGVLKPPYVQQTATLINSLLTTTRTS